MEGIEEGGNVAIYCETVRIIIDSAETLPFRWALFGGLDRQFKARLGECGLPAKSCWMVDYPGISIADNDELGVYFGTGFGRHQSSAVIRFHWVFASCHTEIVASSIFFLT